MVGRRIRPCGQGRGKGGQAVKIVRRCSRPKRSLVIWHHPGAALITRCMPPKPRGGPCSPYQLWTPNVDSREAGVEACQTVIDGGPRPTVAAGAVPDYHPTKPKYLIVDIPMGRSVGGLHSEIQKCGLHDRSKFNYSGRVMIFVWQSGNLDDIHL